MEKLYQVLKLLILGLAIAVLIVGAYVLYGTLSAQVQAPQETAILEGIEETYPSAPDFTFYDGEGKAYTLSDFRGKPVILNFWASWCGPCKREMPEFQTAFDSYGEQIQFLMVDLTDGRQETQESASAHIEINGYTFPVFYDTDVAGATAYGVTAVPVTYFINEEGDCIGKTLGMISEETLQQGIEALLG